MRHDLCVRGGGMGNSLNSYVSGCDWWNHQLEKGNVFYNIIKLDKFKINHGGEK